jgi:RimJ/RimL family protein N-acetyltransferase
LNDLAQFSTVEALRDGRRVEIRALRPQDKESFREAIGRASAASLYNRFFTVKRKFSDKEVSSFFDVDFVDEVALVVIAEEDDGRHIVGGARYIVVEPGRAELAFSIIDAYQGQGLATSLLRHLTTIARMAGLKELVADVLVENVPMMKVFEMCGLPMRSEFGHGVTHVTLDLA